MEHEEGRKKDKKEDKGRQLSYGNAKQSNKKSVMVERNEGSCSG